MMHTQGKAAKNNQFESTVIGGHRPPHIAHTVGMGAKRVMS